MNDDLLMLAIILLGILVLYLLFKYIAARIRYNKIRKREQQREEEKRATAKRRYIAPKLRTYILKRDNYTCQICGISRGFLDSFAPHLGDYLLLEIDHIIPVASGGQGNDADNLQTLCWRCNRKKGSTMTNREVYKSINYGVKKYKF